MPFRVRVRCGKFCISAGIMTSATTPTKKRKSSSTDDSKGPAKKSRHKLVSKEKDEEFRDIKTSLVLPISPAFANDPRAGVEEMLDSMVMK
jgi:DNA-directed RNA polymerase I subunit RPA43